MSEPSTSKNRRSAIYKHLQEWSSSDQSIYLIVIVPLIKSVMLSRRWFGKTIDYIFTITLGVITQQIFWTRYGFSLVPVVVGMCCLR